MHARAPARRHAYALTVSYDLVHIKPLSYAMATSAHMYIQSIPTPALPPSSTNIHVCTRCPAHTALRQTTSTCSHKLLCWAPIRTLPYFKL